MANNLSFSADGVSSKSQAIDDAANIALNIRQTLADALGSLGPLAEGGDETSEAFKQVWEPAMDSAYQLLNGVATGLTSGRDQLLSNVKSFNNTEATNVEGVTNHSAKVH